MTPLRLYDRTQIAGPGVVFGNLLSIFWRLFSLSLFIPFLSFSVPPSAPMPNLPSPKLFLFLKCRIWIEVSALF